MTKVGNELGRVVLGLLLAAVGVAAPRVVDAESADALITRGLELRRQGKPTEALHLFEQAHMIAPSPRSAGNLGLAEASLGQWVEASSNLEHAIAAVDDAWTQKNLEGLQQALDLARQHIGEIVISGPVGVEVIIGGRAMGSLPLVQPIRVLAGAVTVKAVARDYQAYEKELLVVGGTHVSLNLALTRIVAAPVPALPAGDGRGPTPAAPLLPSPQRTWRTGLGAGLAAAGVGLLSWGITWIAVDGHASSEPAAPKRVYDTATKGWILAGIGSVAAAAGGALIYLDRDRKVDVAVLVNSTGVLVGGTF